MNPLDTHNIDRVFHFAPLHYLPFIARSMALKSKPVLAQEEFLAGHFRSTSSHIDVDRGFGDYIHLSTIAEPPILRAKLGAGFPHFGLEIASDVLSEVAFDLCRFNIAKTRYLRRDGKPGFPENDANGKYYGAMQIPIARSESEKKKLLAARTGDPMIEILVKDRLPLSGNTTVHVYSQHDKSMACEVLSALKIDWPVHFCEPSVTYARDEQYGNDVDEFIAKAIAEPDWRGSGLEFDKV